MILSHKEIIVKMDYDPNLEITNDHHIVADTVIEVMNNLNFKSAIEKTLQIRLTAQQMKLIKVVIK